MSDAPAPASAEDSVVAAVIASFKKRSEIGLAKYGTNLDRKDLSTLQWIQHAQEEFMDGILYLEKLKQLFTTGAGALGPTPIHELEKKADSETDFEHVRNLRNY